MNPAVSLSLAEVETLFVILQYWMVENTIHLTGLLWMEKLF